MLEVGEHGKYRKRGYRVSELSDTMEGKKKVEIERK